jgi:pimeloyl-ACP methyl ester carboxylesterase
MGAVNVTMHQSRDGCKRLWFAEHPYNRLMAVVSPYAALLAAVPVRQGEALVLGSRTRYWDYGPEDAPVTVVAVHGYRGEHHGLEPVVAHLAGIRVIGPDLPGFGESTPLTEADHSVEGYGAWLAGFVEALGLPERPVILGHSFGSIVVSHAVADGLETPKLILLNPIAAPALKGPNGVMTRLTLLWYRIGHALPERAGSAWLGNRAIVRFMSGLLAQSKDAQLRRWVHDQHRTYFSRYSDRDTVVEGFRASIGSDVSEVAAALRMPTLLVGASNDPITTVAAYERLHRAIPGSSLHIIQGVGHLIHYEKPREAAEQIVAFLGTGRVVDAATA